jgi:hypothetical protein
MFSGRETSTGNKSRQKILKRNILFRKPLKNNFYSETSEQSFSSWKLKTIGFWLGHHGQKL